MCFGKCRVFFSPLLHFLVQNKLFEGLVNVVKFFKAIIFHFVVNMKQFINLPFCLIYSADQSHHPNSLSTELSVMNWNLLGVMGLVLFSHVIIFVFCLIQFLFNYMIIK